MVKTEIEKTQRVVMLVEDSRSQRALISSYLTELGYRVQEAADGEEADALLAEETPDVALLAWELRGRSGLDVLTAWQTRPETQSMPVLIVTAHRNVARLRSALDAGAVDFISKPVETIELDARIRAALRVSDLERELRRLASRDPLTGLLNRRAMHETFARELDRCRRYGRELGTCLIDVDHFKSINDRFGHDVGDQILVALARAFEKGVRGTDLVARWGGEEFVVLLTETGDAGARLTLERLRESVATSSLVSSLPDLRVSFSAGLVPIDPNSATVGIESVLKCADDALYQAKAEGRNRVVVAEAPVEP